MKLYLDANQGETRRGRAFGYIGTNGNDYCGWFFTWPSDTARIETAAEREAVLDSLDLDETCRHLTPIPSDEARAKLEAYLDGEFDAFGAGAEMTDDDN